jgi:hypothetical protein
VTGPVRLRELGPGEYYVLDAVLAGLSPTSRYHRFHSGAPRLHPHVRERLAAVNGRDSFLKELWGLYWWSFDAFTAKGIVDARYDYNVAASAV